MRRAAVAVALALVRVADVRGDGGCHARGVEAAADSLTRAFVRTSC